MIEFNDIVLIVNSLIAFFAMVIASRSLYISRRTFYIANQEYTEKTLPIRASLIDAFTFYSKSEKYCAFAISYTNQATLPQTLAQIDLELEFTDEEGICGKAIGSPIGVSFPFFMENDSKKIAIPLNLGPRATESGWVIFKIPSSSNRNFLPRAYRVKAHSSDGRVAVIEAFLLRHIADETNINQ